MPKREWPTIAVGDTIRMDKAYDEDNDPLHHECEWGESNIPFDDYTVVGFVRCREKMGGKMCKPCPGVPVLRSKEGHCYICCVLDNGKGGTCEDMTLIKRTVPVTPKTEDFNVRDVI